MSGGAITVLGGGIFGLACAWEMTRRGAAVRVIERQAIGAGASGGVLGALAPHMPDGDWDAKKQFQFDSLIAAEDFWREVARVSGVDPGYARRGRIQALDTDRAVALAEARAAAARERWRGLADWRLARADAFGALAPIAVTGMVAFDTLSARIDPRAACRALAAAIAARGGEIVTRADVAAPTGGVVLDATGRAGLQALGRALGRQVCADEKGQAALLRPRAALPDGGPQVFAGGVHVVPHAGGLVAVGSTSERYFDAARASETDGALDALIARALQVLPALAGAEVVDRWAAARPRSVSRAPVLGAWPGRPGHFVANGGFKIGFGMAVGVARVMAGLILDGEDAIPPGFRVEDSLGAPLTSV